MMMRRVRHVAHVGDMCIQSFTGKPEQKKPLRRLSADGKENIKMVLIVLGWEGGHGINSSGSEQGPVICSCHDNNEVSGSVKWCVFLENLS
jgi:hypothetical protein